MTLPPVRLDACSARASTFRPESMAVFCLATSTILDILTGSVKVFACLS